jgi:hypothetical protein
VARNARAFVENLDGALSDPGLDLLAHQPRAHQVVVIGDLDVFVGRNIATGRWAVSVR